MNRDRSAVKEAITTISSQNGKCIASIGLKMANSKMREAVENRGTTIPAKIQSNMALIWVSKKSMGHKIKPPAIFCKLDGRRVTWRVNKRFSYLMNGRSFVYFMKTMIRARASILFRNISGSFFWIFGPTIPPPMAPPAIQAAIIQSGW